MEYLRALRSELLKIQRTRAFAFSVAAPVALTLFIFVAVMGTPQKGRDDAWIFYLRGVVWSWLLMVTPVYVALLMAILTGIDHHAGTWKLMLAQPISRPPLYLAKLGVGLLLVGWSEIVLVASCLATGLMLRLVKPQFGNYSQGVNVLYLFDMLVAAFLAGLLMTAIHTWLSMRSANIVWSLGIVMLAETANVLGLRQLPIQKYWPWMFPFDAVRILGLQSRDVVEHFWSIQHLIIVSAAGALAVTALALWDFSRRDVA